MKAGLVESNKFISLINIGKKCVKDTAKLRPEMEEVLRLLESDLFGNTNKDQRKLFTILNTNSFIQSDIFFHI